MARRLQCAGACLVFCGLLALGTCVAPASQKKYMPVSPGHNVTLQPVFCNTLESDMEQLYRDNLEVDLGPWRDRNLRMSHLDDTLAAFPPSDTWRLLMVYNNTVYLPLEPDPRVCSAPCNRYLREALQAFSHWTGHGIQLPNAVFLFSVHDSPRCTVAETCAAPFLSFAKIISHRSLPSPLDILVPKLPRSPLAWYVHFPWEHKSSMAAWRGTRWCDAGLPQYNVNCSRFYLGQWWRSSPEVQGLVDFGYSGGSPDTPLSPYMPPNDYARYKFVINLDGFTAAYRLSRLMLMNSAILKEHSFRGEYYYRSLVENKHYIPIFKDNATDLLDVLRYWKQPEREEELRNIIIHTQEFAAKYTCPRARMMYWRRALTEYRHLFPDMDLAIHGRWWPEVQRKLDQLLSGAVT